MATRRRQLADLALQAVVNGIEHKRYKAADLARLTGRHTSNLSEMLNGKRKLALDVIEAAAELQGVDPAEFFADPRTEVKALTPDETEVLRLVRSWPKDVRKAFVTWQHYFAGQDALQQDVRTAAHAFRRLGVKQRQLVLGYMAYLLEGGLPRDVAIALGLPEKDGGTDPEPQRQKNDPT